VLLLTDSNQEIIRLYVSVQEVATVDKLDSLELIPKKSQNKSMWGMNDLPFGQQA
jgi:hypothetical protein